MKVDVQIKSCQEARLFVKTPDNIKRKSDTDYKPLQ